MKIESDLSLLVSTTAHHANLLSDTCIRSPKHITNHLPMYPIAAQLNDPAVAGDPMAKIDVFISMSDSDLDDIMKMQMVRD